MSLIWMYTAFFVKCLYFFSVTVPVCTDNNVLEWRVNGVVDHAVGSVGTFRCYTSIAYKV